MTFWFYVQAGAGVTIGGLVVILALLLVFGLVDKVRGLWDLARALRKAGKKG